MVYNVALSGEKWGKMGQKGASSPQNHAKMGQYEHLFYRFAKQY
jgi:hypothetical protein